jgi:hypothetical protein
MHTAEPSPFEVEIAIAKLKNYKFPNSGPILVQLIQAGGETLQSTELLIPESSPFEVAIATAKLKKYKLPGSGQILVELIQERGETLRSKIHKLVNSIWGKEELCRI